MSELIIDTDIGTNPDDAIAIALALKSPELTIRGITTVYGDVHVRSAIAKKLLRLSNKSDVPVFEGIETPLLRERDVFWPGIEGQGLGIKKDEALNKKKEKHAVQFIIETIMNHPKEITLVTIGPLTNIAAAIMLEPDIVNHVKEVIMMGGVTRLGDNRLNLEPYEHNINSDPEAASIVFESGVNITMVGLDVTRQIYFTRSEKDKFMDDSSPLLTALSTMVDSHMAYLQRNYSYLSDPITVSLLIDKSIVKTKKMKISIVYDERNEAAYTVGVPSQDGNVSVALEIDNSKFYNLLKGRLLDS